MDCENLEFEDNSFDIVLDGGAFSSLDLDKVFPEITRVLKPDGLLIGIETFGHNPFINFKRKINRMKGKRTEWAEGHIFREESIKLAKEYFDKVEVRYFHVVSWIILPFLGLPGGKIILKLFEGLDDIFVKLPFFKKLAFKVVFIFSEPKK